MKKFLKILKTVLLAMLITIPITIPVYAASSSYSFTMGTNGRLIDGSVNGIFHRLDAGQVKITGALRTVSSKNLSGKSNTLKIVLYNKTSGNKFGTITVTPTLTVGSVVTIKGTFPTPVGGGSKYYLYIYRVESDGLSLVGSGSLQNL